MSVLVQAGRCIHLWDASFPESVFLGSVYLYVSEAGKGEGGGLGPGGERRQGGAPPQVLEPRKAGHSHSG